MIKEPKSNSQWVMLAAVFIATTSMAANDAEVPVEVAERLHIEEVLITGGRDQIKSLPGSAHFIDKDALESFAYTDIHRVLSSVPGVYIRSEDGYGLRPNIGMRGAAAERSQKIVIMEDGLLIGPAPYSAPAAYYFPNTARMESVEVFKGPVGIQFGPNTVGGAINLVTATIPETFKADLQAAYGSDNFRRLSARVGDKRGGFSWLLDALTYAGDGFKDIDFDTSDTGFERNDVNMKLRFESADDAQHYQKLDVKVGYANEHSNETYLGLLDADFDDDPYRRYAASQMDHMQTDHYQLQISHQYEMNSSLNLVTRLYRNEFERAWEKFDNFKIVPEDGGLCDVQPYRRDYCDAVFSFSSLGEDDGIIAQRYYEILTGARDSDGSESQKIDVTNNHREYVSQGLQFDVNWFTDVGAAVHELGLGLRLHNDHVDRNHTVKAYNMLAGQMTFDGKARVPRLVNRGETRAASFYLKDRIEWRKYTITAGFRHETIDNEFKDKLLGERNGNDSRVFIPGAGVFYQFNDELGFLLGVNKGYSPNGPSLNDDVDPEESVNWEYGLRYHYDDINIELIGFFNDYSNLIGHCRVSDEGCDADLEFNGGDVEIAGAEFSADYTVSMDGWHYPVNIVYTFTESAFQQSFNSDFSQWGDVVKGDALPYVPEHQLTLESGVMRGPWDCRFALKYTDKMREQAGQGDIDDALHTDSYVIADLAVNYQSNENWSYRVTVDNLTDREEIVSRRPLGARPNKPRSIVAAIRYEF